MEFRTLSTHKTVSLRFILLLHKEILLFFYIIDGCTDKKAEKTSSSRSKWIGNQVQVLFPFKMRKLQLKLVLTFLSQTVMWNPHCGSNMLPKKKFWKSWRKRERERPEGNKKKEGETKRRKQRHKAKIKREIERTSKIKAEIEREREWVGQKSIVKFTFHQK